MGVRRGGAAVWGTGIPRGSKELVPMPDTWAGPEEGEWVERYLIIPIAESASRKSLWKRWGESPSPLLLLLCGDS